jgi:hypothetical protein
MARYTIYRPYRASVRSDHGKGAIHTARANLEQRATATLTEAERRHLQSALTKIITQLADATPVD